MVRQKIHWSGSAGWALACGTHIEGAQHRGSLSPREFAVKYKQSPDMFCKRCAKVAEKMAAHSVRRSRANEVRPSHVGDGVTFSAAEVEHLRTLAEYVSRGFVGVEAREGLRILKGKLS